MEKSGCKFVLCPVCLGYSDMNIAGMEAALFFVEKRWRNFHKLSALTVAGTCKENVHGKRIMHNLFLRDCAL